MVHKALSRNGDPPTLQLMKDSGIGYWPKVALEAVKQALD